MVEKKSWLGSFAKKRSRAQKARGRGRHDEGGNEDIQTEAQEQTLFLSSFYPIEVGVTAQP